MLLSASAVLAMATPDKHSGPAAPLNESKDQTVTTRNGLSRHGSMAGVSVSSRASMPPSEYEDSTDEARARIHAQRGEVEGQSLVGCRLASKIRCVELFRQVRQQCESLLYHLLRHKIDTLLEPLASADWFVVMHFITHLTSLLCLGCLKHRTVISEGSTARTSQVGHCELDYVAVGVADDSGQC